jgi:hypothetical protein
MSYIGGKYCRKVFETKAFLLQSCTTSCTSADSTKLLRFVKTVVFFIIYFSRFWYISIAKRYF